MIHFIMRALAIPLGIIVAGIAHPFINLFFVVIVLAPYYLIASYWEFHGDESETPGNPRVRIRVLSALQFFHGAWGTTLAIFFAFFIASSVFHIGDQETQSRKFSIDALQ